MLYMIRHLGVLIALSSLGCQHGEPEQEKDEAVVSDDLFSESEPKPAARRVWSVSGMPIDALRSKEPPVAEDWEDTIPDSPVYGDISLDMPPGPSELETLPDAGGTGVPMENGLLENPSGVVPQDGVRPVPQDTPGEALPESGSAPAAAGSTDTATPPAEEKQVEPAEQEKPAEKPEKPVVPPPAVPKPEEPVLPSGPSHSRAAIVGDAAGQWAVRPSGEWRFFLFHVYGDGTPLPLTPALSPRGEGAHGRLILWLIGIAAHWCVQMVRGPVGRERIPLAPLAGRGPG